MSLLVSIIVTTYERPHFLVKTLQSILSQTYWNLEVLVIDDGSGDSTDQTIQAISDDRLQFFSIEHSGRPSVPRNFGLRKATGDLIAFCDDDDIWLPEKIERQVEVFTRDPEIKLCYTDVSLIDEKGKAIEDLQRKKNDQQDIVTFYSQLFNNRITFSTVMIRKNILLNGLNFDERKILKASEDYLFLTNVVHSSPVFYINHKLAYYRVHRNGISYAHHSMKKLLRYYIRIMICLYEFYKSEKISVWRFISLGKFHFIDVLKQIIYPYIDQVKKHWSTNV